MISAEFAADFSKFTAGVKQAETQLELFEKDVDQTGKSLDDLGNKGTGAGNKATTLAGNLKGFDAALAAMGLNIRPLIGLLEELGVASAGAATSVGLLTTAGGVLLAAIGGWKVGRKIAEEFNTDEVIGNAIARWMGWGDVAKETAGAVADSLAKASAAAGREITNMADAVQILTDKQKKEKEAAKENAEAFKAWELAAEEVAIAAQDHGRVLDELNPKVLEGAKYALEHGVSQKSVATAFELTKPQIAAVVDLLARDKAALEEVEEANRKAAEALKTHWDGVGTVLDQVFGLDALRKATTWVDAIAAMGGTIDNLRSNELEELNRTMLEGIDAL